MKKLIIKDKKLRLVIQHREKNFFVLKRIFQNSNLFPLIRWNAYFQLSILGSENSITSISPRCIYSLNRKRFNKLTPFSRHVLLKIIRNGKISGIRKSNW
jgi:hypothetical protein